MANAWLLGRCQERLETAARSTAEPAGEAPPHALESADQGLQVELARRWSAFAKRPWLPLQTRAAEEKKSPRRSGGRVDCRAGTQFRRLPKKLRPARPSPSSAKVDGAGTEGGPGLTISAERVNIPFRLGLYGVHSAEGLMIGT